MAVTGPWELTALLAATCAAPGGARADRPPYQIGYTRFRTNIPGSRYVNAITSRAWLADGAEDRAAEPQQRVGPHVARAPEPAGRDHGLSYPRHREVAAELSDRPGTWTQFAGWSPNGRTAIIGCGWESEGNGQWEEEHQAFRFVPEHVLYDMYLLDLDSGRLANLTAVDRVSFYNTGLFWWPRDPGRLGFQAMVNGEMHPFRMDLDGRNKQDLSGGEAGFSYGYSATPDGSRISYHRDYQVYIADADGGGIVQVETGNPFNFAPRWSPDGRWLLFLSGEHYDCHPYVVRADGTGLRRLADRNGWRGVVPIFDVPDHHGGSSDVPVWSPHGRWVYYTAAVGDSVELRRASLAGKAEQLTHSSPGTLNYHPTPSPDGEWLLFGSDRTGVRQLYVSRPDGTDAAPVTDVPAGSAAMWGQWRPG